MSKRKLIGVLMANPEAVYQQRVIDGIFAQCRLYDYDVAVFSPLVQVCHYFKPYLRGELNIFELVNFDLLDGIIVPSITLSEDKNYAILDGVMQKIKEKTDIPVVLIDYPYENFTMIPTDDREAFSRIAKHILDTHKCDPDKVYFLTGMKDYDVSEKRLGGFLDIYNERGLKVDESHIFYGDFWYGGGEAVADKIASGEVPMPQAVVCASDHMAIGVVRRLTENGIKVPEQVIVTGYDATLEAALNDITVTTYAPDVSSAAARAVNKLHSVINADKDELPVPFFSDTGLRICASCGCRENYNYLRSRLSGSLYSINHNYRNGKLADDEIDIGILLESYMLENLTSAENYGDGLNKILSQTYLLAPFDKFYLCLNENLLDSSDERQIVGYPDKMVLAEYFDNTVESSPENFFGFDFEHSFDTKIMLPALTEEERSEPSAFYFFPAHFNEFSMGYGVLECRLSMNKKINTVLHNWMRNVNNCLEMLRIREKILKFSERDAMTGLYNRRGMEANLKECFLGAKLGSNVIAFVIDMDGLKAINDTYGHSEGDYGINSIAAAVSSVTRNNEICVRAGGDEFYIIGVGSYSNIDQVIRPERLGLALKEINKLAEKPYEISASIGSAIGIYSENFDLETLLEEADEEMYKNKVKHKKQRRE